jgi:hypothetical protein
VIKIHALWLMVAAGFRRSETKDTDEHLDPRARIHLDPRARIDWKLDPDAKSHDETWVEDLPYDLVDGASARENRAR